MKRLIALIALLTASAYGAGTMQVKDATGTTITVNKPATQGTAGTPSADVLTVQGATGMTAIKTDGSATTQPISGSVSVSNFPAFPVTQPVSGSISVSNFPATQPVSIASAVPVTGTFYQATQPISGTVGISGTVPVSGTFYQATQPVSGAVAVSNFPASQPVTGTFWQTTQPISGAVSISNFPSSQTVTGTVGISGTVPVSGSFYQATQPVSGTFWQATQPVSIASMPSTPVTGTFWQTTQPVSIASMPSTPVTGTFWQATQPVSGPLTDTQLRATAVPVSGTFYQATQPISASALPLPAGAATETTLAALNAKIPASPATEGGNLATVATNTGRLPALGQATMANSQPVTMASNQSAIPAILPDQTASSYNVGGVIAINTDLLVIDCKGFEGVSIQCTSMGTTGVVTPAWSIDNTTYVAATILTPAGAVATTFNAAGMWTTSTMARYLRLRLTTATTGGTTTIYVQGIAHASNLPLPAQVVTLASTTVTSISAGTNNIGLVTPAPVAAATSALSVGNAASLSVLNIKASTGSVYGLTVVNKVASVIYLQFYNTAGTPTLGTSVISWVPIAASATVVMQPGDFALANYATGIGIGASTTPTSTGTPGTAPDVTIWYK